MVTTWLDAIQPTVRKVLGEYDVPGMVIAIARGNNVPEYVVVGEDGAGAALKEDTLFPVASITTLAVALAVLRLAAAGRLTIDDALSGHLPAAASEKPEVTIRTLMSHTSGLPVDLPEGAAPYRKGLDWPKLARACLVAPLAAEPKTRVNYSNLGSGLLAIIVERMTGKTFGAALEDLVLGPLGVEGYLGVEPPRTPAKIVGSYGEHEGTEMEPFNSAFWRSLAIPWVGLISTASGALTLARAFSGVPEGFLPPALLAEATHDQTGGLGGEMLMLKWPRCPWGLGVELRGDKDLHYTPVEASPSSFGHVGTSGCIAWHDPEAGVTWAMLGPRFFIDWWHGWPEVGKAVLEAAR
jgi:CubicO group peptidase (beta-lactamase class C family)